MLWNSNIKEIVGEQKGFAKAVTGEIVENVKNAEERRIDVDGVFACGDV